MNRMLFYANLEKRLWAEAIATAAYIINRSPTKSLEDKGNQSVSDNTAAPADRKTPGSASATKNQEIHTRESLKGELNMETSKDDDSSEYDTDYGELDETFHPPSYVKQNYDTNVTVRSLRPRHDKNNENKESFLCFYTELTDPETVEEALSSTHATEWKTAMHEEYSSLIKNKTWSLTDLPPGKKALPCKWVFKTKTNQRGNIVRYKARLVIKGYAQRRGADYEETYSPVVRFICFGSQI
ncbi:hypothetical protein evm_014320 [Chilo suppressalis]|nr:hypothetical protein evm_014320 [Chilo suppressalis]